jgi:hypothetical protein
VPKWVLQLLPPLKPLATWVQVRLPLALRQLRCTGVQTCTSHAPPACFARSTGTVEFILDQNHNHYFMEMNTRLQVRAVCPPWGP